MPYFKDGDFSFDKARPVHPSAAVVVFYTGAEYYALDEHGTLVSNNSDPRTVINAALTDAASTGGLVQLPAGIHDITGGSINVPAGVWLRGQGRLPSAGFETRPTKGCVLKSGASELTQVISTSNSYGAQISDLVVDCNAATTTGILMNGYAIKVWGVHVWKPKLNGQCILVTGGTTANDNYMDVHIQDSLLVGGSTSVKAIYAKSGYTYNCSDGNIGPNVRIFGCNAGMIDIEVGGWVIGGPMHIVGNLNTQFGIRSTGGTIIEGIYLDCCGAGPMIDFSNYKSSLVDCKIGIGQYTAQTSLIKLNSNCKGIIIDNIRVENGNTQNYMPFDWFVDLGANPANRNIMIGRLQSMYASPEATATIQGNWAGTGATHYESSTTGYFYSGEVYEASW